MKLTLSGLTLGLLAAALAVVPANAENTALGPTGPVGAMLPQRLLRCDLGLALNLDPHREQARSEVQYQGHHPFALRLPAIPKRTGPPPDAAEPAEPVNPQTRVVNDPDQLTAGVPNRFDRVVDYWPDRVEMSTDLPGGTYHLIIVSDIDPVKGTAMLFMTHAIDAATLDLKHVYSGPCRVGAGKA